MNVLVYDVAAEYGGAASILEFFYQQHKLDRSNHYIYMLSTYHLEETDNITVVNVPKIKQGWIHRLFFDYFGAKKYIKEYNVDEVLSLQNTILPCFHGKQTVYEHNALPFSEYRFKLSEDKMMWVYQNIIGLFMLSAVKKADRVIVQTGWMKKAIAEKVSSAEYKIQVQFPRVSIPAGVTYERPKHCIFFYPANDSPFKNHGVILKACEQLKKDGIWDYSVVFTLHGTETDELRRLAKLGKREGFDIHWLGPITRQEVFALYQKSTLVFPSYIETVGLPIYEAKSVGCPLLLADCKYARDVSGNYENVKFFHYADFDLLAQYMKSDIEACRHNQKQEE